MEIHVMLKRDKNDSKERVLRALNEMKVAILDSSGDWLIKVDIAGTQLKSIVKMGNVDGVFNPASKKLYR